MTTKKAGIIMGGRGASSILKTKVINIQLFAKKSSDFPTIHLPKSEYACVMSEIATNISREQIERKVFNKAIGNYIYTVENNGFGNYRIIGKKNIK
ncbi:MAG: hypothetical protein U0L18_02985 [Acutalibacteraceae bacterium]|nr:hypothetical protein [Acutalibacteraceae bacterium]